MRTQSARQTLLIVLAASIGLLLSTPVLADFKRDYGNGVKALNSGKLEKAVSDLEKAIADNGTAQERVRIYGMRFEPYLPYYYLGEAKFQLGDCPGATAAWQESVNQGIVQQTSEFDLLQTNKASCGGDAVDVGAIAAQATETLRGLDAALANYAKLRTEQLLAAEWSTNWKPALDRAQQQSAQLKQDLSAAQSAGDASAMQKVDEDAQATAASLASTLEQANNRVAALRRQQENADAEARNLARRELIQALAAARSLGDTDLDEARVNKVRQDLLALAGRGDAISPTASPADYQNLSRSINTKLREYRQVAQEVRNQQRTVALRKPPANLNEVAVAYFAGEYQKAASLSDPSKFSEQRERIQAHLFRAAARYNLYVLEGEQESKILRDAEQDIRSIKRLDRSFSPYLAAFSPRFLSLFENTL
jgi:hypothetical protein